jgi:glycosyltransferase involved in cell wall biosynthesis
MKVLIYSHGFAPNIGGVETYTMILAQGLVARGIQASVVTQTASGTLDDAALPFTVVRQPNLYHLCRKVADADVIHIAGPCIGPMVICAVLRKPAVIEHHGYQACCPNGLLLHELDSALCEGSFLQRKYRDCLRCQSARVGVFAGLRNIVLTAVRRKLCGMAAANLAVSHHVQTRLRLGNMPVIYHGIPDTRQELASRGPICFGYIGRMVAEKGLPVLISAAKRLHDEAREFRVIMIGDGPERSQLENMCDAAGLHGRITFTGWLTAERLEEATRDIGVAVIPSICEETAGLAAIEQMMRGRAVLASDIGGLREIVDDVGMRFAPGNAEQLASCMRHLIRHPALARQLGQRARLRAEARFHEGRMVGEHRAVYELARHARERTCAPAF